MKIVNAKFWFLTSDPIGHNMFSRNTIPFQANYDNHDFYFILFFIQMKVTQP